MKNFACLVVLVCVSGCGINYEEEYKTALEIREYEQQEYQALLALLDSDKELMQLRKDAANLSKAKTALKAGSWPGSDTLLTFQELKRLETIVAEDKEKQSEKRLGEWLERWATLTAKQSERLEIARERVREVRKKIE